MKFYPNYQKELVNQVNKSVIKTNTKTPYLKILIKKYYVMKHDNAKGQKQQQPYATGPQEFKVHFMNPHLVIKTKDLDERQHKKLVLSVS